MIPAYKIKTVEPIKQTTEEQRLRMVKKANYNLFDVRSEDVVIDMLTDSGTGALSAAQTSALLSGDESYSGSKSWWRFEAAVKELFPLKHIIPCHQGRAAERILFQAVAGPGLIIPNNMHFDTTRGNIEVTGATALDIPIKEARRPQFIHPFKGNMDFEALERLLEKEGSKVPLVMLTVTNNSGGGQPVSLENMYKVKAVCKAYKKPLFIDACRFAENAWFIREREVGYRHKTVKEIVSEMASLIDGMTMSAKKDGLSHIGGWLALNDDELADACTTNLILTEGYKTYGGMSGRDLDVIAIGLKEVVTHSYLADRVGQVQYMGEALKKAGIPLVLPFGGHAVYIDAGKLLPHIPPLQYPGQALGVALYIEGGIRSVEIGSVMFGQQSNGVEAAACMELVRLAIPRRVYAKEHIDYTIDVIRRVATKAHLLTGLTITNAPKCLRHFTAKFAPLQSSWVTKSRSFSSCGLTTDANANNVASIADKKMDEKNKKIEIINI